MNLGEIIKPYDPETRILKGVLQKSHLNLSGFFKLNDYVHYSRNNQLFLKYLVKTMMNRTKINLYKKNFILLLTCIVVPGINAQSDSSFFTVRLSAFDVSANKNISKLHWKTVCYLQYANFEIQKSTNGTDYITLNSFTADRLRCLQPFDFVDSALSNQGNVFYRVNVGNIDGTFYHSVVRRVFLKAKGFDLVSVYPTIATDAINFSLTNGENETFLAMVVDQRGIIVKEQKHQTPKGLSYNNFQIGNLPSGYYLLQVLNEKGEIKTAKFIKQ